MFARTDGVVVDQRRVAAAVALQCYHGVPDAAVGHHIAVIGSRTSLQYVRGLRAVGIAQSIGVGHSCAGTGVDGYAAAIGAAGVHNIDTVHIYAVVFANRVAEVVEQLRHLVIGECAVVDGNIVKHAAEWEPSLVAALKSSKIERFGVGNSEVGRLVGYLVHKDAVDIQFARVRRYGVNYVKPLVGTVAVEVRCDAHIALQIFAVSVGERYFLLVGTCPRGLYSPACRHGRGLSAWLIDAAFGYGGEERVGVGGSAGTARNNLSSA